MNVVDVIPIIILGGVVVWILGGLIIENIRVKYAQRKNN